MRIAARPGRVSIWRSATISPSVVMIEAGIWQDRAARRSRPYQPRHRRECRGELIQIDGSDHDWFEDRGPRCTLLVYIDDATSELMHLKMVESESTFSYMEATREYIERHGKPVAFEIY